MKLTKIAVLDMNNNHANEGMRCILQAIRNVQGNDRRVAQLAFDVFNVRGNNEIPDLGYDVYVSSGGPGSPMATDEAWEKPYFDLIDQLFAWNCQHEQKKFVFLICHSFQLMVRHLSLGTLSKRRSTSFGIFPIYKVGEGYADPLLMDLPDPFYAVDSRDYQITAPDEQRMNALGATMMCLEKPRPHVPLDRAVMAIRFSDEIVGTQFHPEADNEGMLRYFMTDVKRNQVVANFGQQKYDEMVAYLQDPDKIALTESVILPGFCGEWVVRPTVKSCYCMSTVDILSEIKKLPMSEQLFVVEKALGVIRLEERRDQMRQAADILRNDYVNDSELTVFTALDSEPVHESV